jgi:hypothetical protein
VAPMKPSGASCCTALSTASWKGGITGCVCVCVCVCACVCVCVCACVCMNVYVNEEGVEWRGGMDQGAHGCVERMRAHACVLQQCDWRACRCCASCHAQGRSTRAATRALAPRSLERE